MKGSSNYACNLILKDPDVQKMNNVKEKSLDEIVYFVRKNVPENYEENRERAREFLEKEGNRALPKYSELVKSTYEL